MTAIGDSLIIARVREAENRIPWYIIDPRASKLMVHWDATTAVALIFTALVTPWEVSFLSRSPTSLFVINRVVDLIFCIDVGLQFVIMFPAMYASDGAAAGRRWVSDPAKIARRYIGGWFTFDVLSIAPAIFDIQAFVLDRTDHASIGFGTVTAGVDNLFLLRVSHTPSLPYARSPSSLPWGAHNASPCSSPCCLPPLPLAPCAQVIRILRLVKLFRLVRGSRLLKRWSTRISLPASSLRAIQLVVLILLMSHWMACILALQTTFSDARETWLGRYGHCWTVQGVGAPGSGGGEEAAADDHDEILCASPWVIWLHTSFWAISIIGNLGVLPVLRVGDGASGAPEGSFVADGNAIGLSDREVCVLVFLVLVGVLVWSYVLASFVDIITNIDPDTRAHRNTLDKLNRYLNLHNLPSDNPQLCVALREYFSKSMHLQRAGAHQVLYKLMSPTLQGTVVRQIPWHAKWMRELKGMLNKGRGGLFRDGDLIQIEQIADGVNRVTHLPTGLTAERQDFHPAVDQPCVHQLCLSAAEEDVGASIFVPLPSDIETSSPPLYAHFFNLEAVAYRRTLQTDAGGTLGLATRQAHAADRGSLPGVGVLLVTDPQPLPSLMPAEDAFLVALATSLNALLFAPSELVPGGRLYVIHRGLALLRQRWLGVGQLWGLEMLLHDNPLQQYAAHAASYLEVYCIDRAPLLEIASFHEHAERRLRRWVIFCALRSHLLANLYARRAGASHIEAASAAASAGDAMAEIATRTPASATPPPLTIARSEHVTRGVAGLNAETRAETRQLARGMAVLQSDMSSMRRDMTGLQRDMARLVSYLLPQSTTTSEPN